MADWYAIYQISDGTLVSLATVVADPLPGNLSKKLIAEYPGSTHQWNVSTLDWELAPVPPPDVDRIDEFMSRVGIAFAGPAETAVRGELTALLAARRFRDSSETYEIGER